MSKLDQFKEELNLLPALGKLVNLGCAFSVANYKGKQLMQFTSPLGFVLDITLDSLIFDNFTINTTKIFGFDRKDRLLCGLGDIARIHINMRKEIHFLFAQNDSSDYLPFAVTNDIASLGKTLWIKNEATDKASKEIMQTYKFHMHIYNFIIGAHKLSIELGVTDDR